jgi:hypothetical protein
MNISLKKMAQWRSFVSTDHEYANCKGAAVHVSHDSVAADVKVDVKGDAKAVERNGEEYLEFESVKTTIQVGDSNVKVSVKDDRNGQLSEYT